MNFIKFNANAKEFDNESFNFEDLRVSGPEINITTPENITYTAPMGGYYPTTYGFENDKKNNLRLKAFLNGILAWIIGFILYMIPGFVLAIKMGFQLGPESDDPVAVGEQIGQSVSDFYENNVLLSIGFIVVTSLLILWRAKAVVNKDPDKKVSHGLWVAVFPVIIGILLGFSWGFNIFTIVEILAFLAAGYGGGYLSK